MADIPPALLKKLNRGEDESVSLAETLAVDFALLMKYALPDLHPKTIAAMKKESGTGWVTRTKRAGEIIVQDGGLDMLPYMVAHKSDQVRGWGAALIAAAENLPLKNRLALVRDLADDHNPGVRETAWIMLRPHIAAELEKSVALLQPWTKDKSANIRRYASEITRPRGVWCAYIPALREDPSLAFDILVPLKSDASRYVQNSVANWLNDASKDNPDFVKTVAKRWQKESKAKETDYIIRRALRTINKNKE